MTKPLTYGSLFAGVGGFDQGMDAAGMECRWQVEWDASCQKLLKQKWPNAKHHGDITKVRAAELERVDVVCGGSPCQNLSVAGLRAGLAGGQSRLFHDMVRICKRQRARGGGQIIVWENVDGAFSSNDGRDFAAVLRAFTGLAVEVPSDGWGRAGFIKTPFPAWRWNCAWRTFDAQYFGVAQRRRRVFLVASAGDGSCAEILFEPESLRGDSPPSRDAGQRVTGTISSRTEGGGGLGTDFELGRGLEPVAGTLSASGEGTARTSGNANQASKLVTCMPVAPTLNANFGTKQGLENQHINGGGDCSLPSVGRSLSTKNQRNDFETETLIPTRRGGFFDDAPIAFSSKDHGADAGAVWPTLRSCGHDKSHANGGGPPAVAFPIQSTVIGRDPDGPGGPGFGANGEPMFTLDRSGPPAVGYMPARTLAKDGGVDERFAERPISDALHSSSGNGNKAPIIFHPTQDPIVSVGGPTHSLGCGSTNGQCSVAIAFKPSHFTRGKDGPPTDVTPPLSADADKGDQDPLIFQTRVARNGRGAPDELCPALNGTNAGDTSDMRPCLLLDANAANVVESADGKPDKTNASELLRTLQKEIGEEAFSEWAAGILEHLFEEKILRSTVHGAGIRCPTISGQFSLYVSSPRAETRREGAMFTLRETKCQGCSSSGRELAQQLTEQLGTYLSELSQPGPQKTRFMQDLWEASEGSWVLRKALSEIQEMGRSDGPQNKSAHSGLCVRRLTPGECEFLMGWPRGHTIGFSDSTRYKMCGNGVVSNCAEWIGKRIVRYLRSLDPA